MKVAYLLTWAGDQRTGVFKKVVDQVSAWGALGIEAGIFVATTPASATAWAGVPHVAHIETYETGRQSFLVQRRLVTMIERWNPAITYVRTTARQVATARALHQLPHAIEIQTDDLAESKGLSNLRYGLTLATRRRCLSGARGLVFVSRELAALPSYSRFNSNRTVIGNGISLERIKPLGPVQVSGQAPRLVFMGLPGIPWHGLEDILRLAEIRPDWDFDLIGPRAGDLSLPANVSAHGELDSDNYRAILAKADAAISTLALYRNQMAEASPLKSREYLALGLPVIGCYEDTDIPDGSSIYLRLANQSGAIIDELPRVEAFVEHWRGLRVPRSDIPYLDTLVKERQRLQFLRGLL